MENSRSHPPPASTSGEKPKESVAETVQKMIANLEQTYNEQKQKEIQNLYNDFMLDIVKRKAGLPNILAAIELVKHEAINQQLNAIHQEQAQERMQPPA